MNGVNKVIIVGRLGADPEVSTSSTGRARAIFRVATSETWADKNGDKQERTEWHRVVAWGRTAELAGEYLQKGRQVCVQGRLHTSKWTDGEGKQRSKIEIVADHVTFLDGRPQSESRAA